jgi:outer membrane protein OmpA-like peptidoglycan-associated protein
MTAKSRRSLRLGLSGVGATALLLAGCAHEPSPITTRAHQDYDSVAQDPRIREFAGVELFEAEEAVKRLQQADRRDADEIELEHRAYVAKERVEIARLAAEGGALEAQAKATAEERDRYRLQARSQEVKRAEDRAAAAEAAVEEAQMQAHQDELEAAEMRAMSAEERAMTAEDELTQFKELQARESDRGLVLTLTSGLFAVDRTELQPGARQELDRIADFLGDHPERDAIIEGHTDDQGTSEYNLGLSDRRARVVADHLISRGVERSRVRTEGLGESQPIAPNDTAAGRQENRRVEVVITR